MKTATILLFGLYFNLGFGQTANTNPTIGIRNNTASTCTVSAQTPCAEEPDTTENTIIIADDDNDFSSIIALLNAIELTDNDGKVLVAVKE